MTQKSPKKLVLGIVVPCYNEEVIILNTINVLTDVLKDLIKKGLLSPASFLLLIDDGSRDKTWDYIYRSSKTNKLVKGAKLSANCGHQNAILAGLKTAYSNCDAILTMDADLQDDIDCIPEFITSHARGNKVVYGVRDDREVDSFFKKSTALGFYYLMRVLGVRLVNNHAEFRLMDKEVISHLLDFSETHLFIRGLVPLIGFQSDKVYYKRQKRSGGETKYPFSKMLLFAWEGITSFSIKPLRWVTLLGFVTFGISLILIGWSLFNSFRGHVIQGWTSTVISLYLLGGLQIMSLGILGEYIGKIYQEVKRRPRFIIEKKTIK